MRAGSNEVAYCLPMTRKTESRVCRGGAIGGARRHEPGGGGVMAEDENQEITAALAKLAEEDARAADDAGAALEWIAGDQGPALFTQQRVQNFCWYDLPAKSLTSLEDKLPVAGALAH